MRSSKGRQSPPPPSSKVGEKPPTGVLQLAQLLQRSSKGPSSTTPPLDQQLKASTSDLAPLLSTLSLNTDAGPEPIANKCVQRDHLASVRRSVQTAHLLFLGEAYDHAFEAFDAILQHLTSPSLDRSTEQLKVTALINLLKSAVTPEQSLAAIATAQTFVDNLTPNATTTSPFKHCSPFNTSPPPPSFADTLDSWSNPNFASSKIVFDLLTYYKSSRTWQTRDQEIWAEQSTLREWTCSRLVRLPTWELAEEWLNGDPMSRLDASAVFDVHNIRTLMDWALTAFNGFGEVFKEQLVELHPWLGMSPNLVRVLLFWRLRFFARQETGTGCSCLTLRLSIGAVFTASVDETCCVLARLLSQDLSVAGARSISGGILQRLHDLQIVNLPELAPSLWIGLRQVFAPTSDERCAAVSESWTQ